MNFLLKRYIYGVIKRKNWLSLILVIPFIYLLIASAQVDRFTVWQTLSIPQSAPVAIESSPTGYQTLNSVIDNPDSFFRNNYTVTKLLQDTFGSLSMVWPAGQTNALIQSVRNNMSIHMDMTGRPQILYYGNDRITGDMLVSYYANRLLRQTMEGYTRSNSSPPNAITIAGPVETTGHRAFWRNDRAIPLALTIVLSLFGVALLLWALEWSDPSFKSERQIARYLDVPVLGSMPDLNKISDKMRTTPAPQLSGQPQLA